MNEKEVSEIRRRFRPEKSNIYNILGCYVNEKGEIVSKFNQSLALMPENESEKFLSLLKRTLSGSLHKNLIDIEFSTQQVTQSEEHGLLMSLRNSSLKDEEAVNAFFARVTETVQLEGNYVILLAHDTYDVPYRAKDGARQSDASSEVYSYILCSICPVKLAKPALSYYVYENEFHSRETDHVVSPPAFGFLFPAFDDRGANIYGSLYYTKDITQSHDEFSDTVFGCTLPMPAAAQKETFQAVLSSTLAEDCNLDIVQAVHGRLQQIIEVHKENNEETPLTISKSTFSQILREGGLSTPQVAAFETEFDTGFGEETKLSPQNIIDTKQIEVTTPDVTIRTSAGCKDLIEARVIEGAKYILVRAEDGAQLNGVPIHIT